MNGKTVALTGSLLGLLLQACATGASNSPGATASPLTSTIPSVGSLPSNPSPSATPCAIDKLPLYKPRTLTIATGEPVFEPWMVDDDPSNGKGFESAVAYALAKQMGFDGGDVNWVRTGFDEAIAPGDKPYDFNMQQYTITAERAKVVDFSIPYYTVQRVIVAMPGTVPDSAATIADIKALHYGAAIATTDLKYTEDIIGATDVAVFDTFADATAALKAKQIQAIVINLPTAYYLTAVEVPDAKIVGVLPDAGTPDAIGLLFAKGSKLVPCVNAGLEALTSDGTLRRLGETWLEKGGDIREFTR